MEVSEFEEFIKISREKFRAIITKPYSMSFVKGFLRDRLNICCSAYEEETLKENLQEEFKLYMDSLTTGA